jgi:hypothetical protein
MTSFLSRVQLRLGHVSDETLASFLSGELSSLRAMRVKNHLGRCWQCRARREELERAALLVVEYRRGNQASCLPLDSHYRRSFIAKVEEAAGRPGYVTRWPRPNSLIRRRLRVMNPVFASVVIVSVASVLLFWIWQRSTIPVVSVRELLRRAVASESERSTQHPAGVLYQQVAVRAGAATIHHSIYRDLSGRRHPRPVTLGLAESQVRSKLESIGVDWDQPLSARDYCTWHDRQAEPRDEVERTGKSELTLTTTLDSGEVAQESLTVREDDFHPVARKIIFRDSEQIEIAELNYSVLPWTAVNASMFEPLSGDSAPPVAALGSAIHKFMPTSDQLLSAELQVQLALMQLHANAGEDIRVEPGQAVVHVRGFVDTDDRKRQMDAALERIAFVKPELQSYEQIERMRRASEAGGPLQVESGSPQPSPLDRFVSQQGISQDDAIALSRTLTQASLVIAREAHALDDLEARYKDASGMDERNRQMLGALKREHLSALQQALTTEESALIPYAHASSFRDGSPAEPLSALVGTNQQLCTDLIAGAGDNPQPAGMILNNLVRVSAQIRTAVSSLQPSPRP